MRVATEVGNSKIRRIHRDKILNFIRINGPVSRTEICEKTGISKPTVTRVIEQFNREGLVVDKGSEETLVGRKPVLIEINKDAYLLVGVNITLESINVSIVDLGMNIISHSKTKINGVKDNQAFCRVVLNAVIKQVYESSVSKEKLLGIGVGVPGLVDYRSGIVLDYGVRHALFDIPLKEFLQKELGIPAFVDNNANTRVLGEFWYGYGEGYDDILFVLCSEGVGSGIICEGKILRGKNNIAGELGHMSINMDGVKCVCGKRGCIETYCSLGAFTAHTVQGLKEGKNSEVLEDPRVNSPEDVDYKIICEYADKGDSYCKQRLEKTAAILGAGIANLIGILNTEIVILSGELFDTCSFFYESVKENIVENIFSPLAQNVVFKKRDVKDNIYETGAAAMVLRDFFKE